MSPLTKAGLPIFDEDDPLIDTTEAIQLHSKKTERRQRKQQKKSKKPAVNAHPTAFLDLPTEILVEVLCYLRPSDIFKLSRSGRALRHLIDHHASFIGQNIVDWRYLILAKCFPKPVPLAEVDSSLHPALLSEKRQEMLHIHKKPYQHIKSPDQHKICTCLTCILAWNNLCLIVDLAHWQKDLNQRKPIPMIPRGQNPQWNTDLVNMNAAVVEKAIESPLWYSLILERHLSTTTQTLRRQYRWYKKTEPPFKLNADDAAAEIDAFAKREGPESFEFPYHRDNYYALTSYFPNRRFSTSTLTWLYYPSDQHEKDLEWVKKHASLAHDAGRSQSCKEDQYSNIEGLESKLATLREIGFTNDRRNTTVLWRLNGNLSTALDELVVSRERGFYQ